MDKAPHLLLRLFLVFGMIIDILCSDKNHPVNYMLLAFQKKYSQHDIKTFHASTDLRGGDILFLVSCSEFIQRSTREKYIKALTLHASDLPEGRGWSPHIWQILDGRREITVSLIDAEDKIDTGTSGKSFLSAAPITPCLTRSTRNFSRQSSS